MHQFGQEGFCLLWAVNNALQERIIDKEEVVLELMRFDKNNDKRTITDYIDSKGIVFDDFKKVINNLYGIELKKVNGVSNIGGFIIIVEFKGYNHVISLYNGKVLDNRKRHQLHHIPWDRVESIYRVYS